MASYKHFGPLALPVVSFALVIVLGAILLTLPMSGTGESVSFVDALFTATSAVCVTGLSVVDTGSAFSLMGQNIILVLIQLGGLGITTYTSLIFILWRRRVSITDRLAVGQALLHDTSFDLRTFLVRVVGIVVIIEACGAALLMLFSQNSGNNAPDMTLYAALFHSISAFCNAGFSLFSNNMMSFQDNWGVNIVLMLLITLGGIGFSVIDESLSIAKAKMLRRKHRPLSRHARLVLATSLFLIISGAAALWAIEVSRGLAVGVDFILPALFQSISARTAGFNTIDFSQISDAGLLIIIFLMFIGGSPGSCAGGIKTTTFRVLCGFVSAQFQGRTQIVLHDRAVDTNSRNKAMTLFIFSILAIVIGVTILTLTTTPKHLIATQGDALNITFMDMFFEVVSAFGTAGLSTGITAHLTVAGKLCITCLMFIGRLGPIWLLTTLQSLQTEPKYRWPEADTPIG